ncbi:DinB family protein [Paenibacillus thailandensis]|uniref:DinB family protein n=1 Tax=Paenibacillus thailandensis TaxID=393250 RepID=A0ABW5R0S4_9BACL
MNKMELIRHGWACAYEKEDWHPPLRDALNGVTAEQASWKPEGEAVNSIWENVNHLIFYKERFLKRLTGEETPESYPKDVTNDDTFAVPDPSEEAWAASVSRLAAVHGEIRSLLEKYDKKDFERQLPTHPLGTWAFSLIMHDSYHTGQIIQLRKLQGSWPSRRSFE